ncbi:hypothetical protein COU58_03315 [Candidatus Pacearchaeota archaeon CG10_big_fil_rev_8_21_14_0_10_32_42]|nr:MAG: hypothetical protein COU58_03315 [Candidatus Pacearchaeota archaeon CG10_big_fil_rev_8_21_14_0_10_32_42]
MNKKNWLDCLQLEFLENLGVVESLDEFLWEKSKKYGPKRMEAYDFAEIRNRKNEVLFRGSTTVFYHRKKEVFSAITNLKNGLYRGFSCDVLDWGPSLEN